MPSYFLHIHKALIFTKVSLFSSILPLNLQQSTTLDLIWVELDQWTIRWMKNSFKFIFDQKTRQVYDRQNNGIEARLKIPEKNLSISFLQKKFWRSSKKLKILHFFVLEAREERKYELS